MTVFGFLEQFGLTAFVAVVSGVAALGAWKMIKEWLPW